MREKRIGRIIILCAFIIIICCSRGIWFFAERYLDSTNYENRQMAVRPTFTVDGYESFSNEYTSYFNDNLPFRNALITLNSAIDYFCFGRGGGGDVVVGKNNWLFYSRVDDGDPISCYKGTYLYTDEQLAAIADNCVRQRDFVESMGKEFVILIVPNKERMYSEYMPEKYGEPAENYPVLQIYNYLKENTDLRVLYLYDDLMRAKEKLDENIYCKTDTHWNYVGAYVGASVLLKEFGIDLPDIDSDSVTIRDNGETSGDLADLLNLRKQLVFADHNYTVEGYDTHDVECTEYDFSGMWSFKAVDADPRTIYVLRDSFSSHMGGYIGSQFSNTYLRHHETYSYDDLVNCDPDIVVYECVERGAAGLGIFSIQ